MCEKCKEQAARIVTAIEAHKAELVEVLADIAEALASGDYEEAIEAGLATREGMGIRSGPFIIGYLLGNQRMDPVSKVEYAAMINAGLQAGYDRLNFEGMH